MDNIGAIDNMSQANTNSTVSAEEEAEFLLAMEQVMATVGSMALMPLLSDIMSDE